MVKTRSEQEFSEVYGKYFDNIYSYIFLIVKNKDDSADIAQDVFYKFYTSTKEFNSDEHKKAWLLTCAHNASTDYFRAKSRKNLSLDEVENTGVPFKIDETLALILKLPIKYKEVIYMHYYEGYSTEEIAKILKKPHATVRTQLKRGREVLKIQLQ